MKHTNELYTMKAVIQAYDDRVICRLTPCNLEEIDVPHVYQLIACRKLANSDSNEIVDTLYATFITDADFEVSDDEDDMCAMCEDLVFESVSPDYERVSYTIRKLS